MALALLFGANAALMVYSVKQRRHLAGPAGQSGAATSLGGLAAGLVGVGCAACGTIALAPVLSLAGAGSLLAAMPFGGEEFSALGIGLLGLSLYLSGKALATPVACTVFNAAGPHRPNPSVLRDGVVNSNRGVEGDMRP